MRDLARQNLKSGVSARHGKPFSRIFRLGAIVIGIVTVVLFFNSGIGLPVVGGGDALITDAPRGLTPVDVEGGPVSVEGGVNLASDTARFTNVSKISASASAERVYGGGSFTMTVEATFAGVQGHRYQVWLTDGENVANAGFMEGTGKNWSLIFRDSDKGYSDMNGIWITDELTTEDEKPELHILEGSF